jgi:hypothetical protein
MSTAAAIDELGPRLLLDLLAVCLLAFGLSYRRQRRRDLVVVLTLVNVAVFLVVVVIAGGRIDAAVGFGLFAVLSIVRLRSEPVSNPELGYFLIALALALVTGIDVGGLWLSAALCAVALGAAAVFDHPKLLTPSRRVVLVLEATFADQDALRRHVEERLDVDVIDLEVDEVDYVRETTRVAGRCVDRPRAATSAADLEARLHAVAPAGR